MSEENNAPQKRKRLSEKQRARINQKKKALRAKRRKEGLCTKCGKPLDRDGALCTECLESGRQYQNERRNKLISLGLCPICGINIIFEHEKSCPECKAKKAIAQSKNQEYYREWGRNKVAERRANGLCPQCGKRPVDEGYKSCSECREKARKKYARKEKPYKRNEWSAEGRCAVCGKDELVPYKRVCWSCYGKRLESVKKCNENREQKEKSWHKTNVIIRGKYNTNYNKF